MSFAWISLHFTAWRHTVTSIVALYQDLPTEEPPQCFVATAAAHGHRALVGGRATGATRVVTLQLQRLKAFELVLAMTLPAAHARLRRVYNAWGPRLAGRITNPWLADAAYLLLKPLEYAAAFFVLPVAGVGRGQVERLYAPPPRYSAGGR